MGTLLMNQARWGWAMMEVMYVMSITRKSGDSRAFLFLPATGSFTSVLDLSTKDCFLANQSTEMGAGWSSLTLTHSLS